MLSSSNCFIVSGYLCLFLPFVGTCSSLHKTPLTSKCLHIASSRRCQIREDCFAHRARIGGRHLRNARACLSKDWACTSCATLASCVAPKFPTPLIFFCPASALIRFVVPDSSAYNPKTFLKSPFDSRTKSSLASHSFSGLKSS